MKKHLILFLPALLGLFSTVRADEGMWLIGNISPGLSAVMSRMGLQLTPQELYSTQVPSLKDAVVRFEDICSGVMVSEDGLLLTNHHCGFSAITQLSSEENNYVRDGYIAMERAQETPIEGLFVRFLEETTNVTGRIEEGLRPDMTEEERRQAADSISSLLCEEKMRDNPFCTACVDSYFSGNEYWMSVYYDYCDVRLVFAPPSSIGKFGGDTDNWMWPRHTGDFCMFRVYATPDNRPATYQKTNVPYHPKKVVPLSLKGYQEGDFTMTIGYPGSTRRFLSSYGIREMMQCDHQAVIEARGLKLDLWNRQMKKDEKTSLKYAADYNSSSNYWKNCLGTQEAIRKLNILKRKQDYEQQVITWINQSPERKAEYGSLLDSLSAAYTSRAESACALAYTDECFISGPELIDAIFSLTFYEEENSDSKSRLLKHFQNLTRQDLELDCQVMKKMLRLYQKRNPGKLPLFYQQIQSEFQGNPDAFAENLYRQTIFADLNKIKEVVTENDLSRIFNDPGYVFVLDLFDFYFKEAETCSAYTRTIERNERLLNKAIREMETAQELYPDANSTMRLSFGTVAGYRPKDGIYYKYYTTVKGILEKRNQHPDDADFQLDAFTSNLIEASDNQDTSLNGEKHVCFLTSNDITGGNSGSAVFNGKGELIGLAFDGNWEAMSSDLNYEPELQRCIAVDIRYVLSVITHAGGEHLIKEMDLK